MMRSEKGSAGDLALDALLQRLGIMVVEMSAESAIHAPQAYARFGKGVGSPALLNYGDCLAYGVAAARGEPLLFKRRDFGQPDIERVNY